MYEVCFNFLFYLQINAKIVMSGGGTSSSLSRDEIMVRQSVQIPISITLVSKGYFFKSHLLNQKIWAKFSLKMWACCISCFRFGIISEI